MADHMELLEAALDSFPEGMGLFRGGEGEVVLWNQAAQGITGYAAIEVLGRQIPEDLEGLRPPVNLPDGKRMLTEARHKLGHCVQVIARILVLRNGMGERIGSAVIFHPVESLYALPHGESAETPQVKESRAELEERLHAEFDDFVRGGPPLGVLWISVDQSEALRKTHGVAACNDMLEKVRRALAQGLRPAEEMGRWSDSEFLIVAHERNAEMLAAHAQTLAGVARTADFRWWGDRVSLTVSIGAAQASRDSAESLADLLRRAREAMETSFREGGNRATTAASRGAVSDVQEDSPCSPS